MPFIKLISYEGQTSYDWTVRARTFSKITHSALRFEEEKIEAMPFVGVRKIRWGAFPAPYKAYVHGIKGLTEQMSKEVWEWLLTQEGKGYDYWGIFGYTIGLGRIQHKNKWFCSELCEAALRQVNIVLTPGYAPCKVSPARLFNSSLLVHERTINF